MSYGPRKPAALTHAGQDGMAGVDGFEPPNVGIKIRCLTAWRNPCGALARTRAVLPGLQIRRIAVYASRALIDRAGLGHRVGNATLRHAEPVLREWWVVVGSNHVCQRRRIYSPLQSPMLLTTRKGFVARPPRRIGCLTCDERTGAGCGNRTRVTGLEGRSLSHSAKPAKMVKADGFEPPCPGGNLLYRQVPSAAWLRLRCSFSRTPWPFLRRWGNPCRMQRHGGLSDLAR